MMDECDCEKEEPYALRIRDVYWKREYRKLREQGMSHQEAEQKIIERDRKESSLVAYT